MPSRPAVLDLLASVDLEASNLTCRPWRLKHLDGRPFTPFETALFGSANAEELDAHAGRLEVEAVQARDRQSDLNRILELAGPYLKGRSDRGRRPDHDARGRAGRDHQIMARIAPDEVLP